MVWKDGEQRRGAQISQSERASQKKAGKRNFLNGKYVRHVTALQVRPETDSWVTRAERETGSKCDMWMDWGGKERGERFRQRASQTNVSQTQSDMKKAAKQIVGVDP